MASKHKHRPNLIHCPCCGTALGGKNGVVKNFVIPCPECGAHIEITVNEAGHRTVVELPKNSPQPRPMQQ